MARVNVFACCVFLGLIGVLLANGRSVAPPSVAPPSVRATLNSLPLPSTLPLDAFEAQLYSFLDQKKYMTLGWPRDKGVRDTGPYINGAYTGPHPAVRIFYSPEVYDWLKVGRPDGTPIPDGAIIIKEMYAPPAARYGGMAEDDIKAALTGWTVMIRDSSGSRDGWFWAYYGKGQPPDSDAYPYDYPNAGFGQYCVRCHASARNEFTFSSLRNIEGEPGEPILYRVDNSWLETDPNDHTLLLPHLALAAAQEGSQSTENKPIRVADSNFLRVFSSIPAVAPGDVVPIPPVTLDHVVAPAVPPTGPEHFLTSDQCMSCHDGQGRPFGPNMFIPPSDAHDGINLSPYGEWNWSMMGLAGRDPIFYAQLESELALQPGHQGTIQNLCLTCHGVMGQRQWHSDGNPGDFTLDTLFIRDVSDPNHRYGALARDGISCTVCHQIVDDGLPLRDIVTGRFQVASPVDGVSPIFGPVANPTTRPMETVLGMKPVQSEYVQSSRLCAGCHTIYLPVFDQAGTLLGHDFEQSTYLEWLNSAYQNELGSGSDPKTCQTCHMTDEYHGQKLAFQIANIQDQTYPEADNLAALNDITVPIRGLQASDLPPDISRYGDETFKRHTLLGINQFALEMFNQFDDILGVRKTDYMTGSANGLPTAIAEADRLAKQETATVEILSTALSGNQLTAEVKVTNLTGHRFPSGVGFRRAFLAFHVVDDQNNVVWASGRTDSLGVIVDETGQPLASEFFEVDPATGEQVYQPHYDIITGQDQVLIYEELVRSPEGRFTTSFLNQYDTVKDNRLLPKGWTPEGPAGFREAYSPEAHEAEQALEATLPKGNVLQDSNFLTGDGSDTVTYRLELPASVVAQLAVGRSISVDASLYYQAIPPFYLQDRFTTSDGDNTQRLHYIASHLNLSGTNIEGWKLLIQSDQKVVSP